MRYRRFTFCLIMVTLSFLFTAGLAAAADTVPRMSVEELNSRLGEEGLVVLDVRAGRDWIGSDEKITGAKRVEQKDLGSWAERQDKSQSLVLYCS